MANFHCWINDANGRRRRKWRGLVKLFDYSADQAEVIALWLGEYANFPPLFFLNHKIWRQIHHGRVDEKTTKVCDVMRIPRCCNGSNSPPGCKSTRIEPSIDHPPPLIGSCNQFNLNASTFFQVAIWTNFTPIDGPRETAHLTFRLEDHQTKWSAVDSQKPLWRVPRILERDAWPHRSQKTFDRSRLGL